MVKTPKTTDVITSVATDRRQIPAEVLAVVRSNAKEATKRMAAMLEDDTAWGKGGWMPINAQIKLAEAAMDRSFGKPEQVKVDPASAAARIDADSVVGIIDALYQRIEHKLPERGQAKREEVEVVDVTPEPLEPGQATTDALRERAKQARVRKVKGKVPTASGTDTQAKRRTRHGRG